MIFKGMNLCDFCFEPIGPGNVCTKCGLTHETYHAEAGLLMPGTNLLGKYIIGRVLGRGGFGATYLAYSSDRDEVVAIKEYYPTGIANRATGEEKISIVSDDKRKVFNKGAERFFKEAKIMSHFNTNKNVVSVYEFFYANDTVYYSMEYLEGIDLKGYISKKGGKLSEAEAVTIMRGVCDALVAVHSTQTLHRDISPGNIFICANGGVKLIGFGSAKQAVQNERQEMITAIVNQGFTPLEQYAINGKVGYWTDIYGLGASIYYAVTGKVPDDAMNRVENPEITFDSSLNLSPRFMSIIKKCLQSRIEDRYQSAIELLGDLNELDTNNVTIGGKDYVQTVDNGGSSGLLRKLKLKKRDEFNPENNFPQMLYASPNPEYFRPPVNDSLSSDYEGRCGNCHQWLGEDEYCRYCGTKKGEGKFEPYDNFMPTVYGPPMSYIHKCRKCGTQFTSSGIGRKPDYCYNCGNLLVSEKKDYMPGRDTLIDVPNKPFVSRENFNPPVYASPSPEQLRPTVITEKRDKGYNRINKPADKFILKNNMATVFIALGIAVCIILTILIVINL